MTTLEIFFGAATNWGVGVGHDKTKEGVPS